MRGYFGIGIYQPKTKENVGTLWRTAYQLGAAFIFVIGKQYKQQDSDTLKSHRHIPLWQFKTIDSFLNAEIYDCKLVGIELNDAFIPIANYEHPTRAIYLLGNERSGFDSEIVTYVDEWVSLPSIRQPSYNVAVAGSLVMFHRHLTSTI